eukprot:GHVO01012971.1.p1 GENE.GHVO01012971.1~~GHVO01012971.1.p1  ORF type:complete len:100 (+),score=4.00 GHVO01012971.1:115-414(+)
MRDHFRLQDEYRQDDLSDVRREALIAGSLVTCVKRLKVILDKCGKWANFRRFTFATNVLFREPNILIHSRNIKEATKEWYDCSFGGGGILMYPIPHTLL